MRGIRFGFVATTLLAQVDASIGGKNGVNFYGYKNTIGTITQPQFVINDISFLKTLPKKEFISGFSEVVKYALINNGRLFSYLEKNYTKAQKLSTKVLEKIIYECVRIKARVVEEDTCENGERRKLNFGHTLGHALERTLHIRHGEAVSMGMIFAADLSEKYGFISKECTKKIRSLLTKSGLPIRASFDKRKVIDALMKDKKKASDRIHFIFLEGIGKSVVKEMPMNKLTEHINDMC
jgi:3-dehydroquinate synthase